VKLEKMRIREKMKDRAVYRLDVLTFFKQAIYKLALQRQAVTVAECQRTAGKDRAIAKCQIDRLTQS
jgi:hypothetical protein